jgi:peptidoglycan/LPS O-acetylase OafA/YrhL
MIRRVTERKHIPALDGIRGVAVLMVLSFHLFYNRDGLTGYLRRALFVVDSGWVGVDLFFVLSGFLITGILLRTKESPRYFRTFYARRALRIFPLYYGVVIVAVLILPHFLRRSPGIDALLARQWMLWTYTTNFDAMRFGSDWLDLLHFWSLAIEEQFYLVWPAIVYFAPAATLRKLCWTLVVMAPICRLLVLLGGDPRAPYLLTPCRADALAIGALVAVGWTDPRRRAAMVKLARRALPPLLTLLALLVVQGAVGAVPLPTRLTRSAFASKVVVLSLVDAAAAGAVILAVAEDGWNWLRRLFETRPLRWIGRYSYGLYVFQIPLLPLCAAILPFTSIARAAGDPLLARVIYFLYESIVVFVVAVAAWHLWEARFLRLKARFRY